MMKVLNMRYIDVEHNESKIRGMGPPSRSLLLKDKQEYDKKMEEFIMASKYIMTRFLSNFYYPDEIRSSSPESRDEIQHIGKLLKYVYKPSGKSSYSKTKLIKDIKQESDISIKKIKSKIKIFFEQVIKQQ